MRYLQVFGKFLISLGVGVLLFVAWTLWGTGFYTDRAQAALAEDFDRLPAMTVDVGHAAPRDPNPFVIVPESYAPAPGEAAFRLEIPSIDLTEIVVEGVGTDELRRGPGHYPGCRSGFDRPYCTDFEEIWPGEKGRVIVSGHRTTYGAPFWDISKLKSGDRIVTETKWGEFTYEVTKKEIVPPDSLAIAVQSDDAEIVLTTCNPRFSAAERLIVFAELVPS